MRPFKHLFLFCACFISIANATSNCNLDQSEKKLWKQTISPLLNSDLWNKRDIYDAGHYLMVPIHFAFKSKEHDFISEINSLFSRYSQASPSYNKKSLLSTLHFDYLTSQYLLLKSQNSRLSDSDLLLLERLQVRITDLWINSKAWWYDKERSSRKERLIFRLENKNTQYKYYRLMPDEDMFIMAIASDLYKITSDKSFKEFYKHDLAPFLLKSLKEFLHFTDKGGLIFKPGIWSDHPDMAYSGNTSMPPKHKKSKLDVTIDSSHAHRYPLWLKSFTAITRVYPSESKYIKDLKKRLTNQFVRFIYAPPTRNFPFHKTNNYMDGYNGLYRYNYATTGVNNGYGPYELSGTLLIGWWSFLESRSVQNIYSDISKSFPLSKKAIELYVGPNTTRERHPIIQLPDSLMNGLSQIIAILASKDC